MITAGPTWVAIDPVRVISNTATGKTGILLAEKLHRLGAKVHLVLGPVEPNFNHRQIKISRFCFFEELKRCLNHELRRQHFDYVFHAAAVSDYRTKRVYEKKVESGLSRWCLELVPTSKIIKSIRQLAQDVFLIGFKFLPQASKRPLVQEARKLMRESDCDLVVANTVHSKRYRAWIVGFKNVSREYDSREELVNHLIKQIS